MAHNNFHRCYGFIHEVEQGDTLYKLGKKYGVTVSALLFANPYVNVYNMQIGDEICIPKIRPIVIPIPLSRQSEEEKSETVD